MRKMNCKIAFIMIGVLVLGIFPFHAFAEVEKADVVYVNGNIYTVDEENPHATAIAVKGQYATYVGDDKGVKDFIGDNTKIIDLKENTVIPGLIEGHMHYPGEGEKLLQIDAFWKPKKEILDAVKAEADRLPDGEWIIGRGWNQEVWPGEAFPTKEELDAVAPNNPVALVRTCGHATWANSLALEIAGITKDTPDPQGGEILRDNNGEATGVLTDTAASLVRSKIPPFNETRQKEGLMKAQEELFSLGITSSMDAGSDLTDIQYMKDLYQSEDLKIRIYTMASSGETAKAYYKKGPEIGLFDNRLTIRAIKFYADGSLGARSAWMLEEYSDRAGHKGNGRYTDEEFYQLIKEAREHGFQVATHAIGDAANRQCVDTYEKILKEMPLADHRYRIEHFQVATLEDIKRIAEIGIIPAMQAVHATSDKNMAEDRVGSERIKGAYAWRKVMDAGSIIVNGSDAPVELVNPYHGLYAAVTRMDREGNPPGGWYSNEAMTREEALKSFTIWAAYGQFEEDMKGSLEKGKLADFVVIDRDYMKCPAMDIKDIQALMTVVGGEIVYERASAENITVMVQGKDLNLENIMIEEGRTLVNAKELFEKMDMDWSYNAEAEAINMMRENQAIGVKSKKIGDEIFVSLRSVGESLGYKVMWYEGSKTISMNK